MGTTWKDWWVGAQHAAASGVDVNVINSCQDSHPCQNTSYPPEVIPSPINSHHLPLKQILYCLIWGNRGKVTPLEKGSYGDQSLHLRDPHLTPTMPQTASSRAG